MCGSGGITQTSSISPEHGDRTKKCEPRVLMYTCWRRYCTSDYDSWIQHLVCVLLPFSSTRAMRRENVITSGVLLPLCQQDSEFCEMLLPYIFYELLKYDSEGITCRELSSAINAFFQHALDNASDVYRAACKTMTRALDVLRTFAFFHSSDSRSTENAPKTYGHTKQTSLSVKTSTGKRVCRKPLNLDYCLVAKCVEYICEGLCLMYTCVL